MSALQNTTQRPDRIKTRLRTGALALSMLIALGAALLILPTAHRATRPPTASIARPAQPAALTPQASGLGNCLVNAHNQARACYQAAQAPTATPAPPGYFRDPTTHALLLVPAEGCDAAQLRVDEILRAAVEPGWIKEGAPTRGPSTTLHAGEVVPSDRLIEELWGERPPATAAKTVQVYVSNLRKALGDSVLLTRSGGYELRVTAVELDATQFEALAAEGQRLLRAGDFRRAAELLGEALGLWRGPALADFAYESFAQADVARLEESRLVLLEDRIDAELGLGEHSGLVGELEGLVRERPLRERPVGQLMLALYRSGRQADALEVYRQTSERFRSELGLEPGPRLRELERSILNQDATVEPPPRADPSPPVNLPVPATAFVGRRQEVAACSALLQGGGTRLLTLTGAGGSGKTRLALRIAETCAAAHRDGTWFVAFADITDPELIVATIGQTLGLAGATGLAPVRRLGQWLEGRQVLLVLDNLEQLAGGSAVLAEMLGACPGVTLVVTSREPLHLAGEQQYDVPVLEPGDAVALFESRTQAVVPGLVVHPKLADAICARLDYLPLAIELAAARTKALAPPDILKRLDKRLPLLTGGPRDAPRRQQMLRATLDWSYELLDAEQRRLLARLAVFAGGCTFGAAEAVCGAELDTLHALVDRSLARTDGTRYWMLPTLREY